jgi:hypothetical protein
MALEMNTFTSYENLNTSQVVYLGYGKTHQICGYGDISIMLNIGGRKTNSQRTPCIWFNGFFTLNNLI